MSHEQQVWLLDSDRDLLRGLKQEPGVVAEAERRGIIRDAENRTELTFDELVRTMVPEDAETLEHPEDQMVRIYLPKEAKERVSRVAGRGVTERRVLLSHAARLMEEVNGEMPSWALEATPAPGDNDE